MPIVGKVIIELFIDKPPLFTSAQTKSVAPTGQEVVVNLMLIYP